MRKIKISSVLTFWLGTHIHNILEYIFMTIAYTTVYRQMPLLSVLFQQEIPVNENMSTHFVHIWRQPEVAYSHFMVGFCQSFHHRQ